MTCLFTQPQAAASTLGERNKGLNPTSLLPSHRSQVSFFILHKNLPFFVCNNRTAAGLVFFLATTCPRRPRGRTGEDVKAGGPGAAQQRQELALQFQSSPARGALSLT